MHKLSKCNVIFLFYLKRQLLSPVILKVLNVAGNCGYKKIFTMKVIIQNLAI